MGCMDFWGVWIFVVFCNFLVAFLQASGGPGGGPGGPGGGPEGPGGVPGGVLYILKSKKSTEHLENNYPSIDPQQQIEDRSMGRCWVERPCRPVWVEVGY